MTNYDLILYSEYKIFASSSWKIGNFEKCFAMPIKIQTSKNRPLIIIKHLMKRHFLKWSHSKFA